MDVLHIPEQFLDQRRGRYVRVSDTDRRQLIDAYKKGEDFIALAKKLNIKRSTGKRRMLAINDKQVMICFSSYKLVYEIR